MTVTIIQGGKILDSQNLGATYPIDLTVSGNTTGPLPVSKGGTGTATGSITGTGALTFSAGTTTTNIILAPGSASGVTTTARPVTLTGGTSASSTSTGDLRITGGIGAQGTSWLQALQVPGAIFLGAGANQGVIFLDSSNVIKFLDTAFTGASAITLGPATSSFVRIKRSTTTVQFRLGDDSADTRIQASAATFSALGNYTDDASAAAGGVPVGGLYRNLNIVQIRTV